MSLSLSLSSFSPRSTTVVSFGKALVASIFKVGMAFLFSLLVFTLSHESQASTLKYKDKDLAMKDIEEMQSLIRSIRAQKTDYDDPDESRNFKLIKATELLFSRKDIDGTRSKLYRSLAADMAEYENEVLAEVVKTTLQELKTEGAPLAEQSTRLVILENFMAEMKPRRESMKQIFEQIRDADIKMSKELVNYRRLNGMRETKTVSEIATVIIGEKK
jgi:hypothetical protein